METGTALHSLVEPRGEYASTTMPFESQYFLRDSSGL